MRALFVVTALLGLSVPSAFAAAPAPPPPNAKPLSQLLQSVEQRPGFLFIDEVDWEHGAYEVEYYTKTGTKVELRINPVSGEETR